MIPERQKRVLITQDKTESEALAAIISKAGLEAYCLPLETYFPISTKLDPEQISEEIDNADNIVFGSLLSARFFMHLYGNEKTLELMRKKVNLALDRQTSIFLESHSIPAISAYPKTKPIDLVEFMLRLNLVGRCLYPCGKHFSEELPGLFIELDIPCHELPVYDRRGPKEEELRKYREQISANQPDFVVFHNIDSVRRSKIAFPELDFSEITVISLHESVSRKLSENEISVNLEWDGKDVGALKQLIV